MKKRTLIAAAAALLISGGVFMKVNKATNMMFYGMIEAISGGDDDCYLYGDGEGGGHYDGEYDPKKDPSTCGAYVVHMHKGTNTDYCNQCECKILQMNGACNDNSNIGYYKSQGWHIISGKSFDRTVCVNKGSGCTWTNAAQHGGY